jgi:Protein of unknown function (DUF2380)
MTAKKCKHDWKVMTRLEPLLRLSWVVMHASCSENCAMILNFENKSKISDRTHRSAAAVGCVAILTLVAAVWPMFAAYAATPQQVKIAVFDFELEDASPSASSDLESGKYTARMQAITDDARRSLAQSGRYIFIDTHAVDAEAVKKKSLRSCNGCDVDIALKLGAERSFIGLVTKATNTDYYVSILITDTKTGKPVNQQSAFFTGADDAWASGVRMLLKHAVLADPNY